MAWNVSRLIAPLTSQSDNALTGSLKNSIFGPLGAIYGGIQGNRAAERQDQRAQVQHRAALAARGAAINPYGEGGWANMYGTPAIPGGPQAPAVAGMPGDALNTPTALPSLPAFQYQPIQVDPRLTGLSRTTAIEAAKAAQERQAGMQRQIAQRNFLDTEYLRRIQQARQQLQGYGEGQREELSRGIVRNTAAAAQQAQQRGFGNSSMAQNLQRGVQADAAFNRARLEQSLLDRQMQTDQDLTGQRLNFLNSIQDESPSQGDVRNLVLGTAGARESKAALKQQIAQLREAQNKQFWASIIGAGFQGAGTAASGPAAAALL